MASRRADDREGRGEPDQALNTLSQQLIGAAIEVHRELGPGLPENIYERALAIELETRGIQFVRQAPFEVRYKGHPVGEGRLDLLIEGQLVVELKAVEALAPIHTAQVITYLRATHHQLGILINFNVRVLKNGIDRIVLS